MQQELLRNIAVERKPGSLVVLSGELPYEELERHKSEAVKALSNEISLDGFRKGHVPENVLVKAVGEMPLLTEMAERTLKHVYPELVKLHGLDVIGYPQISITKIAKGNPLGFTITVAVVPEVILPDYEKLAKEINKNKESKEVTDADVDAQAQDILRQKVAYERLQKKAAHAHDHVHDENGHHPDHDKMQEEVEEEVKLPELTDEYVRGLGKPGQFESVADFKQKLRDHLTIAKAQDVDSRHRAKLTDAVIEKTKMDLPQVLVDAEIHQMFSQMEEDLKRAQLKMEDYLGHIKKTRDDLKKEWTPSAEKRAKLQLVLNAIAKKENITPDPSFVDHEVSHILERYKDADEKRVRVYVNSVLTNEAVMKKLESAA